MRAAAALVFAFVGGCIATDSVLEEVHVDQWVVPVWEEGDFWEFEDVEDDSRFRMEVVGQEARNGTATYLIQWSGEEDGILTDCTMWIDQATLGMRAGQCDSFTWAESCGGIFPLTNRSLICERSFSPGPSYSIPAQTSIGPVEEIDVPAGRFVAVEHLVRGHGLDDDWCWYSDEVGYCVKSDGQSGPKQLVSFSYESST